MSTAELATAARAVKQSKQDKALAWCCRADDASMHWAGGQGGSYVVTYHRAWSGGGFWNAAHEPGRRRRQLGTAATVEQAKALAQRDHDLATERRS